MDWFSIASTAASLWGTYSSVKANQQAANTNSERERINAYWDQRAADLTDLEAGFQEKRHRVDVARILAGQRVAYSKSGVSPNSVTAQYVEADTMYQGELDITLERYRNTLRAMAQRQGAASAFANAAAYQATAKAQNQAAVINAGTTILGLLKPEKGSGQPTTLQVPMSQRSQDYYGEMTP